MSSMFGDASSFNQPLTNWDTGSVIFMRSMFDGASSFNQPIGNWDTGGVTNMDSMFRNASAFNQNLSTWCVTLIPSVPSNFATGAVSWVLPRPVWGTCPVSAPFSGNWVGTYSYGTMSAVLQQTGGTVQGQITDTLGCVWNVSGSASGTSLSLPSWTRHTVSAACVEASVTMQGTLDATGNTITGTGSTNAIPWTFTLTRQ